MSNEINSIWTSLVTNENMAVYAKIRRVAELCRISVQMYIYGVVDWILTQMLINFQNTSDEIYMSPSTLTMAWRNDPVHQRIYASPGLNASTRFAIPLHTGKGWYIHRLTIYLCQTSHKNSDLMSLFHMTKISRSITWTKQCTCYHYIMWYIGVWSYNTIFWSIWQISSTKNALTTPLCRSHIEDTT